MHRIYNCMPETNQLSRVNSAAAVLYLQSELHVMLFRHYYYYYYYYYYCNSARPRASHSIMELYPDAFR